MTSAKKYFFTIPTILIGLIVLLAACESAPEDTNYQNNRSPLVQKPYIALPLGSIKAKGWLEEMLIRQKNGATGSMDLLYPQVMGERNGWLGGDGDQWERGPYWVDGLLPLAYLLDDQELKDKVQPWVEWALASQQPSGLFGPAQDYPHEEGIQRNNSLDWWPRMVTLKILQQYYSATGDERVIPFFSNYFKYQLATLPEKKLDNWTFWARYRAGDNLQVIYWLYNITGEAFLLDLGKLMHSQSHDFEEMFTVSKDIQDYNSIHCVNLAQGIKEPIIHYQQTKNKESLEAVKMGFADIKRFHGQAQGMYGGDEGMHGNNPTQGVELCSVVEMMYSLENMIEITGELSYIDHLEKITFNALPTQVTDDFMHKQYFQQANQVMVTRHPRNFYEESWHGGTDVVFGTRNGYPCCYSNMHQGWPKFVQSLWFATPDNGLAALAFSPSEVTAKVGKGVAVKVTEDTFYPMDDKIRFTFTIESDQVERVEFPFHVRIPSWCKEAKILVNGEMWKSIAGGTVEIVKREWKTGDIVELSMPMEVKVDDSWFEKSISVERGPLVYALKIEEEWSEKKFSEEEKERFGESYWEVYPKSPWNFGILDFDRDSTKEAFEVSISHEKMKKDYFWNLENAPIELKVKARTIPNWKLYNESAGPLPFAGGKWAGEEQEITLIPYGTTTLRIAQFPVVR